MAAHPTPFADTLAQLRAAIDEPWESVAMTLDLHPPETLGDPADAGSAAWHLRHTAEVFRAHARRLMGDAVDDWPPLPDAPTDAIDALRADVQSLTRWFADNPDPTPIQGQESVSELLGIMLRHVVWHAAAAHYWCQWKRPPSGSEP